MNRLIIFSLLLAFNFGCTHLNQNLTHLNKRSTKTIEESNYNDSYELHSSEPSGNYDSTLASENPSTPYFEQDDEPEAVDTSEQSILDQALDFCQAAQEFWQKGEPDNAIQSLDQAYSLILNTEFSDSPKVMQQKEDIRFMISKRILEIYASRNTVVNGNHNAIPLIMNREIQDEIKRFTTIEKKFFEQSLKRSGRYRPQIVKALREAGLPEELSWLPLVESGFKIRALSKARALGLWQFIPSTGYKFGLKRNEFIDERLDPDKSTQAAIAYMTELHKIFGDWTTVLAAYNCGEGRVLKIIRHQNINYLDNFWDLYGRLPRETARYVPRFLATLHIVNSPEKYGFSLSDLDNPVDCDTLTITKQIHLKHIADKIGVDEKTLSDLNPALRYKILPDTAYTLRVPASKGPLLLASLDEISLYQLPQHSFSYHRVRRGETLSTIARRYHTNVRSIARANNIGRNNLIVAGKILKIPHRGATVYYSGKTNSRQYDQNATKHIVKRGDSLWIIARRYGTTTKTLQKINNLPTSDLHIGQVLLLPASQQQDDEKNAGVSRPGSAVYQVKRGDSPFSIAMKHNINLNRLLTLNNLTSKSKIYPGQKLYIE